MSLKQRLPAIAHKLFPETAEIAERAYTDILFMERLYKLFEFFAVAFCALYQIYMMAIGSNIWYIHLILLVLSLDHFFYKLVIRRRLENVKEADIKKKEKHRLRKELKKNLSTINSVYTVASIALRCFVIGTAIYALTVDPSALHVICTTLIATELLVELIIRTVIHFAKKQYNELTSTFSSECDSIKNKFTAPIEKTKEIYHNIVDKFSGEDSAIGNVAEKIGGWFSKKFNSKNKIYIENTEFSSDNNKEEETV